MVRGFSASHSDRLTGFASAAITHVEVNTVEYIT
jgi:hypothetical protein